MALGVIAFFLAPKVSAALWERRPGSETPYPIPAIDSQSGLTVASRNPPSKQSFASARWERGADDSVVISTSATFDSFASR
jgi:hypothetical protein